MLGMRPVHVGAAIAVVLAAAGGVVGWRLMGVGDVPAPPPPVSLSVVPADGAVDVGLNAAVEVSATLGRLERVAVTADGGAATPDPTTDTGPDLESGPTELPGAGDGQRWRSSAVPLQPGTAYSVSATVVDGGGRREVRTSSFKTVTPAEILKVPISPLDGQTVGIGMPLALYPTVAVADHDAFESRLKVTTSPPVVGAWHWFSDTELHYRPENFWTPGTVVSLEANLGGYDNGGGVWAVTPRVMSFTIGEAHISTVDAATHQMTVTSGGTVLQTFDVSTGRDEYPTASGIHVVSEKSPQIIMDSATVGIPRGSPGSYRQTVFMNVRISDSGEFVHSAPWSVADQGQSNVSHGCVNLSPENARWFYDFSVPGDIVEVVGTPTQLEPDNGFGDWNVPWSEWDN